MFIPNKEALKLQENDVVSFRYHNKTRKGLLNRVYLANTGNTIISLKAGENLKEYKSFNLAKVSGLQCLKSPFSI